MDDRRAERVIDILRLKTGHMFEKVKGRMAKVKQIGIFIQSLLE
jgi:hypothetical protein